MSKIPIQIKANYVPETGLFVFKIEDRESGASSTIELEPACFAQMIEYLDLVLASYSDMKAKEKE